MPNGGDDPVLRCAKAECAKPAVSDGPVLCAHHFLEFMVVLGGVVGKRLEREATDNSGVDRD